MTFGAGPLPAAIQQYTVFPAAVGSAAPQAEAGKALQGDLKGLRNLRVARFRVIYRAPERRVIESVAIGPRDRIYEETLRLVSAEKKRGQK